MFSEYYNQTLPHKVRTGTKNKYNEYTYSSSSTINCRVTYKRQLFRRPNGEELLSSAIIHTETAVKQGDKLTIDSVEYHVELVYPFVTLEGDTVSYKVIL